MRTITDYRDSHTHVKKGCQYDRRFGQFKWRKYLWACEQRALDKILHQHFAGRTVRYLDFACGTGRIIQFMKGRVDTCTGIDVSESMLNECRQKLPDDEIIQADITRDNVLGERVFDLITAFRFFPNAQNSLRREAGKALAKHLAPDGLFVFNNHRTASSTLFTLGRMVKNDIPSMSNAEVDRLVASAGLEIVDVFPIGVLPGYDNHPMILPSFIHKSADWVANACGVGRALCQDIIYVCRKTKRAESRCCSRND